MTHVLYRIARGACPRADRPWLDALIAELSAIETNRARVAWLLGASTFVIRRHAYRMGAGLRIAAGASLVASGLFATLWLTGYEGVLPEDDWYPMLAALCAGALIGVSILNLNRDARGARP